MPVIPLNPSDWARLGALALAYFLAARLGLFLASVGTATTLFWPPSGIALAALLLYGKRLWPGILLGAFLANMGTPLPLVSTIGISAGNTLAALFGAWLLRPATGFDPHLRTQGDVVRLLVLGALASPLLSAANGALWANWAAASLSLEQYGRTLLFWWMGDASGVALFAVISIAFIRPERFEWTPLLRRRALMMFCVLTLLCALVFTDLGMNLFGYRFRAFTLFPVLIWAAFVFNLRTVSLALLVIYGFSLFGLHAGIGRFGTGVLADKIDVWLYNSVIGVIGLCMVMVNEQRKQAEKKMRLAAEVFESSGEAIMITDANACIQSVNRAFTRDTGYLPEDVRGKNPRILSSGLHDREFYREMWASITRTDFWQGEIWDKDKSGRVYPKLMSVSVVRDDHGEISNYISISSDITQRKEAEKSIHALAFFDVLTRLPNRTLLRDRIDQLVAVSQRERQTFSLLFIDLDRFKYINDSMGHAMGDKLLQVVGSRLLSCVREGDTVSRIGGDEFVVLLRDTDASGAAGVAEKILASFEVVSDIEGVQISTHASIGISIYPDHAANGDTLIKNADAAMYFAKEQGRNNFQFYSREMDYRAQRLFSLEKDIRLALERGEFSLHFQPQLDLTTGRVCGAEALLRWKHPQSGDISPADFIPVAEETGQIVPMGEWVLRTACACLADWQGRGIHPGRISVNLSMRQLRDDSLASQVETALLESGLAPGELELELTEGIMMLDTQSAMGFLQKMRKLGVHLSIDDFGTGFSSLGYLKRMPLNKLKIDQSFVRDIEADGDDAAIVRSIIGLARRFRLRVIAEGVESQAQMDFLREQGCDEIQGYYFSRPLPANEFADFVRNHSVRS